MRDATYPQLWAAVRAARKAGRTLESVKPAADQFQVKHNGDIVTEADRTVEETILRSGVDSLPARCRFRRSAPGVHDSYNRVTTP